MILYEVEDMEEDTKGLVEFGSVLEADKVLREKGFKCIEAFEFYVGNSKENGNEICVMKAFGVNHMTLKEVTHK